MLKLCFRVEAVLIGMILGIAVAHGSDGAKPASDLMANLVRSCCCSCY